ncbi:uncharacterized protein LOC121649082 [Melanotaenia boesemani]|uniref:uncharacterized protein LOC121649082 n=1 Tax=Melanotaenia boesemani TaxID=1250792 RepID=UPI001C05AF5D|nr:uncharacterized protein LOC121649082 [Melanotaenia boesemani]
MESVVGNGCFRLVREMANIQGRDVFVADLYVTPTWLDPGNTDPLLHFPKDADQKDALIIPLWIPGHFLLSVMRPLQKEIFFLDSLYFRRADGFSSQAYRELLRGLAQQIVAGAWTEKTALDLKDVPKQTHGNDCGVFMIMYAWYFAMDACFDFGVDDMCLLRRWWCIVLLENFGLEGYGRKFAHFTDEGKATLRDNVPPVFRITRKRKLESPMVSEDLIQYPSLQPV